MIQPANLANAYAKVNHRHRFLFEAVADETIHRLTKPRSNKKKDYSTHFTAQGLANIANAFAKTNHHNRPDLFQAIAKRAIPIMDTFNSQNFANAVNAYAKVDHYDHKLLSAIANNGKDCHSYAF